MSIVNNIEKTKGEAFNIGSGEVISIENLVNMILGKIDKNLKITYESKSFPEITNQYLDSSKIKNLTGWVHSTNLSDGLDASIKMYEPIL